MQIIFITKKKEKEKSRNNPVYEGLDVLDYFLQCDTKVLIMTDNQFL